MEGLELNSKPKCSLKESPRVGVETPITQLLVHDQGLSFVSHFVGEEHWKIGTEMTGKDTWRKGKDGGETASWIISRTHPSDRDGDIIHEGIQATPSSTNNKTCIVSDWGSDKVRRLR